MSVKRVKGERTGGGGGGRNQKGNHQKSRKSC